MAEKNLDLDLNFEEMSFCFDHESQAEHHNDILDQIDEMNQVFANILNEESTIEISQAD